MNRKVVGIYSDDKMKIYVDKKLTEISSLGIETESHGCECSYKERYNITRFPTFLFIKNQSIAIEKCGKFMDNTLIKQLQTLRWI